MTDPLAIDPSEPTPVILSRLFFAADGRSVSIGEPNKGTAAILKECDRRFFILSSPVADMSFDVFREQTMKALGLEGPHTVEGKSADWVTVWNVARHGGDRCISLAFAAAYAPGHRIPYAEPETAAPEAPQP